jgi:hypothetical protein
MAGVESGTDLGWGAERLLDQLPGGFPQPYSKLQRPTWHCAAQLFAATNGRVKLRELCDACCVSHRTAWRIREALRDSARMIEDRSRDTAARHTKLEKIFEEKPRERTCRSQEPVCPCRPAPNEFR